MTTRKRIALFGLTLGLIAACGPGPTELCACSYPGPFARAFGTVTAGGAPLAGAEIHASVMPPGCSEAQAVRYPFGGGPVSAADGSYELSVPAIHGGNTNCVRIVAQRAAGDSAFTLVPDLAVGSVGTRTRVDVAFP